MKNDNDASYRNGAGTLNAVARLYVKQKMYERYESKVSVLL